MRRIQNEMETIAKIAAFNSLPLHKQLKKQQANLDKSQLHQELLKLQWKKLDAAFKSQDRESRSQAFASRTNAPVPGKYNPRWALLERKERHVVYRKEPENEGRARKFNLSIQSMGLCPHMVRTLEDWSSKKQLSTPPSPQRQATTQSSRAKEELEGKLEEAVAASAAQGGDSLAQQRKSVTSAGPDKGSHSVDPKANRGKGALDQSTLQANLMTIDVPHQSRQICSQGHARGRQVLSRGTIPANSKPIAVRVLPEERIQPNEPKHPHSPLRYVSPAVVPTKVHFKLHSTRNKSRATPQSQDPFDFIAHKQQRR